MLWFAIGCYHGSPICGVKQTPPQIGNPFLLGSSAPQLVGQTRWPAMFGRAALLCTYSLSLSCLSQLAAHPAKSRLGRYRVYSLQTSVCRFTSRQQCQQNTLSPLVSPWLLTSLGCWIARTVNAHTQNYR